jgi:hypothetical protein
MQDSRRASSSALAHAALPASGLGANFCHDWSDAPLICLGFSFAAEFPMVQFHVNPCGFGLMLGMSHCHVRSLHLFSIAGRDKILGFVTQRRLCTPGYPYRQCLSLTAFEGMHVRKTKPWLPMTSVPEPGNGSRRSYPLRCCLSHHVTVLQCSSPCLNAWTTNRHGWNFPWNSAMLDCQSCHVPRPRASGNDTPQSDMSTELMDLLNQAKAIFKASCLVS